VDHTRSDTCRSPSVFQHCSTHTPTPLYPTFRNSSLTVSVQLPFSATWRSINGAYYLLLHWHSTFPENCTIMDEVIPGLWIGDFPSALNIDQLKANNIYSILSVMRGRFTIHKVRQIADSGSQWCWAVRFKDFISLPNNAGRQHRGRCLSSFSPVDHIYTSRTGQGERSSSALPGWYKWVVSFVATSLLDGSRH
jgi:hypothetical protein